MKSQQAAVKLSNGFLCEDYKQGLTTLRKAAVERTTEIKSYWEDVYHSYLPKNSRCPEHEPQLLSS